MGLFLADGTRRTKSTVNTTAPADPYLVLAEDLYETVQWDAGNLGTTSVDKSTAGGAIRKLWRKAGTTVRQSEINAKFPPATITSVSPASGAAAGGTSVTLKGTFLDGVTAVTFGGNAATAVTVVDPGTVTCTTAAHVAGATDIVVTDDSGPVTVTGGYTFV